MVVTSTQNNQRFECTSPMVLNKDIFKMTSDKTYIALINDKSHGYLFTMNEDNSDINNFIGNYTSKMSRQMVVMVINRNLNQLCTWELMDKRVTTGKNNYMFQECIGYFTLQYCTVKQWLQLYIAPKSKALWSNFWFHIDKWVNGNCINALL